MNRGDAKTKLHCQPTAPVDRLIEPDLGTKRIQSVKLLAQPLGLCRLHRSNLGRLLLSEIGSCVQLFVSKAVCIPYVSSRASQRNEV